MSDKRISDLSKRTSLKDETYYVLAATDDDNFAINLNAVIPTLVSDLDNDEGYITTNDFNTEGYLAQHQDLLKYAKKTDLDDYIKESDVPDIPTKVSDLENDANYINKVYVDTVMEGIVIPEMPSLDGYAKLTDLDEYVKESELPNIPTVPTNISAFTNDVNYITESVLNGKGYMTSIPEDYITESALNDKGYITTIPEDYITESDLNSKGYITSIPEDYITESDLNSKGYATEDYVSIAIGNAQLGGDGYVDLSEYAKKDEVPVIVHTDEQDNIVIGDGHSHDSLIVKEFISESDILVQCANPSIIFDGSEVPNMGAFKISNSTKENVLAIAYNDDYKIAIEPDGDIRPINNKANKLGSVGHIWADVWTDAVRTPSSGMAIIANDDDTDTSPTSKRNGLWINSTGIRPLNGDGTMTCGENNYRWSHVWVVSGSAATSDRELKTNINRVDMPMAKSEDNNKFYNFVKDELAFYTWDWKQEELNFEGVPNIGVIAQELEQSEVGKMIVIPPKEEGNNYAISERNMYMSLGIALKQAINEIESLKEIINQLKEEK